MAKAPIKFSFRAQRRWDGKPIYKEWYRFDALDGRSYMEGIVEDCIVKEYPKEYEKFHQDILDNQDDARKAAIDSLIQEEKKDETST